MSQRAELRARALALIDRLSGGSCDDEARDGLICDMAAWQAEVVEPYKRLVAGRGVPHSPDDVPPLPTDVFRFCRVAAHDASRDARVFESSGTTQAHPSQHCFADLGLYDRAARAAAKYALFPDVERMTLVVLAPDEVGAPRSSLSYMLARFVEWFGAGGSSYAWRAGQLDAAALRAALDGAASSGRHLALLGTSLAFVHTEDVLGSSRWQLPRGSRIMQTGGFKGRSREVEPAAMLSLLSRRYGMDEQWIAAEYGMTELSSQMYELCLREAALGLHVTPRRLWVPGWVRATPVDPESSRPCRDGAVGALRIDDCANLDSACAIQTSDLAMSTRGAVVLLGREPGAVSRGCSIAADELLGAGC